MKCFREHHFLWDTVVYSDSYSMVYSRRWEGVLIILWLYISICLLVYSLVLGFLEPV